MTIQPHQTKPKRNSNSPSLSVAKRFLFVALSTTLLLTSGCGSPKVDSATQATATEAVASNEEKNLTGSFTAGGKGYSGRVSTQQFEATGQFSVLCQDDTDPNDPQLIQFVFKNESSARAGGNFTTAYGQGKEQAANEASLAFDINYRSEEDSGGTVTISKSGDSNELVFESVSLKTMSKETAVVSGKIPF